MKRLTILCIIAFVGLIVVPATVIAAGPPGGLDVNVVNPIPLPVTGDINATVTGDVNVTNTPDVNVINTDPIPVQIVERPASQPVEAHSLPILPAGQTRTFSPIKIFTVPSGKLLVIEHFSMWDWEEDLVPPDTGVVMVIYTKLSKDHAVRIPHSMGIAKVLLNPDEGDGEFGPRSIYSLAQPVRIYAGPETDVSVNIFRNYPVASDQVFQVTMSGHYVNIDN